MANITLNIRYIFRTMEQNAYHFKQYIECDKDGDKSGAHEEWDMYTKKQVAIFGAGAITGISQKSFWDLRRVVRTYMKKIGKEYSYNEVLGLIHQPEIIDLEQVLISLDNEYHGR